ncbi:predicted protein [Saccharomyces cerevisiae RM11-1a]|uniref:Uncharacterized protein n=1 Tax=Saccharomyces cerevisiae (strain RM11-1a) TaxID=285006 RepID=B3LRX6_YEAS1|nr:predicted protein [Saccharomyces cerevisiae RM11-1a]
MLFFLYLRHVLKASSTVLIWKLSTLKIPTKSSKDDDFLRG